VAFSSTAQHTARPQRANDAASTPGTDFGVSALVVVPSPI
jgi:hypothetical protein